MPQVLTVELTARWSANTISGSQFVGVLGDDPRLPRRVSSVKEVFIGAGAIATAAGEAINEPVGKPALALGNF